MKTKSTILAICLLLFPCSITYAQEAKKDLFLEQVVIVSRHNVRAPLQQYFSTLDSLVPPKGYNWERSHLDSVGGSNLTPRGAALEVLMGQYFALWFKQQRFKPKGSDCYFGANSKQRTIATARAFASGLLPLENVTIDYKVKADGEIGYLDSLYLPMLNSTAGYADFDTLAFKAEAQAEITTIKEKFSQVLEEDYPLMEKVLRYKKSLMAKEKGALHFDSCSDSVDILFYGSKDGKEGKLEPTIIGDLKLTNRASDAFILNYYELEDMRQAAFGRRLSDRDWERLAEIKDIYSSILFCAPIIAVNVSHCLVDKIQKEMESKQYKVLYYCSHDTMLMSLLCALQVEDYELPNTIEKKTPLAGKILIETWIDTSGVRYVRPRYLYQSSAQIRGVQPLHLHNPPMSYDLNLKGLERASNGMYPYEDFMNHLKLTVKAYEATAKGRHPFQD